jgi:hypothetical protein
MKSLKYKDIKTLREDLLTENEICPLCECIILDPVLDHDHVEGHVRGVLCRRCNSLEGILLSRFKRAGLMNIISFSKFVQNLSDYINAEPLPYMHPKGNKPKKLMKSSYNELKKAYKGEAKFPPYPKSKKMTKKLERLFAEYNIEPKFYNKRR